MVAHERRFVEYEDFDEEYIEDEKEFCPEGYSDDEWCMPELRCGVETCELCCPWNRLDRVYAELEDE